MRLAGERHPHPDWSVSPASLPVIGQLTLSCQRCVPSFNVTKPAPQTAPLIGRDVTCLPHLEPRPHRPARAACGFSRPRVSSHNSPPKESREQTGLAPRPRPV
ncbi:hypothetical protein E2C01_020613 [Portunus trituberculatus]|uniref:Uncharacterized protein n=1 Tax=Portunus trituberculatus TaxID=210409 RepID=A0A5B7E3W8_PORTR|nr:hypothetical protein [Portunus trituberculatus]